MRKHIVALMALFAALCAAPSVAAAQPVEYVKVCDAFGTSYFYSPGTDSCVNAITGEVKTVTEIGTMHRQTHVIARTRALESDYCDGCFAVVAANGRITRSERAKSSTRTSTGRFDVIFWKPVDGCALNATLGSADGAGLQPPPGMITVARAPNTDDKGVTVWTYNAGGNLVGRSFHLSLQCKHKKPFCEVIDDDGTHACTGNEPVPGLGLPGP